MLNFYPGPSQLYPQMQGYAAEAFRSGLLARNHRSEEFSLMFESACRGLKEKLSVPTGYEVLFVSSATEAWEVCSQAFSALPSHHFHNGAFGEKWTEYRKKIAHENTFSYGFGLSEAAIPGGQNLENGLICLTQNETSNGLQIPAGLLEATRRRYPEHLVLVDATSSLGGVALPMAAADVWLASVQKCFGMPPGLGLMICSPRAIETALRLDPNRHYNSFTFLLENARKGQTNCTPNTLGIYMLGRLMQDLPPIEQTSEALIARAAWCRAELKNAGLGLLSETNPSDTVLCLGLEKEKLEVFHRAAFAAGFLLGKGYGAWKDNSFRIANFPAVNDSELGDLFSFLKKYFRG